MPFRIFASLAIFLLLANVRGEKAFAEKPGNPQSLDTKTISKQYFNGEMDLVESTLTKFLKSNSQSATKEELIFAYKYLSVIYAANSKTKTKAEGYMTQLLRMVPTIELLDMYVNDQIQSLFKAVKQDFFAQQHYQENYDELGQPKKQQIKSKDSTTSHMETTTKESKKSTWKWWALGGGTAVVAVGTYIWLSGEPDAKNETLNIDLSGK